MPKEEKGYWFSTENGTHIHAEEGESKESAMKKKFTKFGKKEDDTVDITKEAERFASKVKQKEGEDFEDFEGRVWSEIHNQYSDMLDNDAIEEISNDLAKKFYKKEQPKPSLKERRKEWEKNLSKSADDDTLDEEFGKDTPERKLVGAIKDTTFEEINEKRMSGKSKKHDYSEIFDEDYQRSWGIPDFKDENDIKTLNDIVEKAMEYDGEEGAIDISNNAMDRIGELVKFSPEEQDKLASGTGEEIMDILRSKETKSSSGYTEFDLDDYLNGKISPEEWEKAKKHNTKLLEKNEQKKNSLPKYEEGKPGKDYDFYDDGTFTTHSRKTAHSSFEEPSVAYDDLGRFYGIDLEKVIYGKGGYEEQRDKSDFQGDIIYSEKEWDKFENWLKQKHGVDLEQIRKDKFEEYKKTHTPRKRLF